jgi:hypothetical protein
MAWNDTPTVEAWLARARASALVPRVLESLPAIRARGFGVTVASPDWVAHRNGNGPSEFGGAAATVLAAQRPLVAEAAPEPVLVADLDDEAEYQMVSLAAPVFGAEGEVVLTVSVSSAAGERIPGAEVRAMGDTVVDAADRLTDEVHGRHP